MVEKEHPDQVDKQKDIRGKVVDYYQHAVACLSSDTANLAHFRVHCAAGTAPGGPKWWKQDTQT